MTDHNASLFRSRNWAPAFAGERFSYNDTDSSAAMQRIESAEEAPLTEDIRLMSAELERCRRLALSTNDVRLINSLNEYALELERGVAGEFEDPKLQEAA